MTGPLHKHPEITPHDQFAGPRGVASVHLDALRSLAALSVLLSHWQGSFFASYSGLAHPNALTILAYYASSFGHRWVIVFFVLSGYLVGGSVIRAKRADRWSLRSYLLARVSRLYVVLLPALLLGGLADWAGMHLSGADSIYSGHSGIPWFAFNVHSRLSPGIFAGNVLFLETILVPALGTNGPLWSLVCEFWYYLAFPVLVFMLSKSTRIWMRLGSGLLLIVGCWFVGREIVVLAIPWLMGVSIVYLPPVPLRRPVTRRLAILAALVLFTVGMVVAQGGLVAGDLAFIPRLHIVLGKSWNFPIYDLLLSPVITLLIWVLIHCARSPMPSGYVWLARSSARSSYTLYLIHLPALIFLKALWQMPRAAPAGRLF
jgi:peptidoglycan/LPS O-acetylase OafA/YrhL